MKLGVGMSSSKNQIQDELKDIFEELNLLSTSNSPGNMARRIELCRKALKMVSKDTQADLWGKLQDDLANSLVESPEEPRAEQLEQAIDRYRQALEVRTYDKHPNEWAATYHNLAVAYQMRIKGNRADNIEEAIRFCREALTVRTPEAGSERWAMTQLSLAGAYHKRICGERAENLEQALQHCKQALKVYTREAFEYDWAQAQNILGEIYRVRLRGSRAENIEESIQHFQQALSVHTRERFPEAWARVQNNLVAAYTDRIRGEPAENLELAIRHANQALEVRTRESDSERWAMTQYNLGNAYRFRIYGDPAENIEQAIYHFEQALQVHTRSAFPKDWARAETHLGSAYLGRMRGERAANIERAIRHLQQALKMHTYQAFPEDWAQTQNLLGNAYLGRMRGEQAKNIEESIHCYRQALKVRTREAFPKDWAETRNNLAIAYADRKVGVRQENIEQAIHSFQRALEVYTLQAFPDQCLKTARALGNLAFEEQRWELVREAYGIALDAQGLLMQAALSRAGKQTELVEVQNLPARTVYAHLQLKQDKRSVKRAVEVMEQGRAQLLRESLERQRKDLEQLRDLGFEHLYQEYVQAMKQHDDLQRTGASQNAHSEEWVSQMEQALGRMQAATTAIREKAGKDQPRYRYFLKALPFKEIRKQAMKTPLVYLGVTSASGFALVVTRQGTQTLILPELNRAALQKQIWRPSDEEIDRINAHLQKGLITPEDIRAVSGGYFSMYALWSLTHYLINTPEELKKELSKAWRQTLDDTTRWLWESVMGKLLPLLKDHGEATLIPAGHLALLPLHAAWIEDSSKTTQRRYALDELNITYAPSAHALWQASLGAERPAESLLVVDNPDGTLLAASDEVRTVLGLFKNATHVAGQEATIKAVTQEMQKADVLHFATHGRAGWQEENQARLKLADGYLTLPDIFELRLTQARIAVLSACETGVPGLKLIDEMIGLPAGMMQAGVPGVVGSLWSVSDMSTAVLMKRFYKFWQEEGKTPQEALRQAQIWLRDKLFRSPYHWAAFTYTGV
jgi:CHAT domain-containing protein